MSEPSIIKFVAKLQDLGVKLNLEAGELKVKAPKGILQGELLAELKEKKQAIQEYIKILSSAQKKSKSKIPQADRSQALPLSYGQQRLWFLDQLSIQKNTRGNAFYNMPMVLKIEGELNLPHFEESVKIIISRHEILRTNFVQNESALCQVIHKEVDWSINNIDLRLAGINDLNEENKKQKITQTINDLCLEPFDLAHDLLFRIHLIRVSEECSYFVNVMHHIIGDAWSTEILFRELVSVYLFGEASLPKLDIQYADYAVWQREWLIGDVLANQLAFWQTELNDVPALQLPFDRIRPAFESHRGARVKINIEHDLYKRIKHFSEKNGVTLFMTLMASYQLLMFRYSSQYDFAVGTPVANRDKEELSNQLGFFINTLAIRSCTEEGMSFLELIAKVKNRLLNAYSHQELPFEQIVESLKLERTTSHAPVFQTMLVLNSSSFANQAKSGVDTSALGKSDLAKLKISMLESEHVSAKFDLNCELVEAEQHIFGHFEYNTDLFDEQTIQQMVKHFSVLLEAVLQNPSENISAIKFLEKDLCKEIYHHCHGPSVVYPVYDTVSDYLNTVLLTEENKNLCALRFEGRELSYAELHQRSERLAAYLQNKNLRPQVPVALCLDRSIEMVVGLLAVIKTGSPYLPLDPELPQERLEFMLQDSAAQFVLTQQSYANRFSSSIKNSSFINSNVLNLDDESVQKQIVACNTPVVNHAKVSDVFNIIYTSGSTGNPKGVMVTHAGILNRIQWMQSEYQLKPSDKVLQKTTYSFDVSVWEFIWPLSQGACLVLAKPEGHKDPEYLKNLMHSEQISHCHFVPSMLQIWLEQAGLETLSTLQKVFCSGEALSREVVNHFYQTLPDCELHNLYGPTEASIDVSYWHCEKNVENHCSVPIGKPVANTQLWVLDKQGLLLAPGVSGELHISGVQLAKGYLNRDDLNRTTFIEQTIDGQTQRLYKTGDLVRQRRDGVIEYLGRIDHQVKIRGYRIELGEIESRLQSIEGVALSVVVADNLSENKSQKNSNDQQLIAYVSMHLATEQKEQQKAELIATIKTELSKHLPAYMVPSVVMVLDEMPLLNNGKINRKRLPKAEFEQATFIAPSTETEIALAEIWQTVLGVEKIGILDNFFELGGHSLLATRVASRIKNKFNVTLPLVELFNFSQLKALAEFIDTLQWAKQGLSKNNESPASSASENDEREDFEL